MQTTAPAQRGGGSAVGAKKKGEVPAYVSVLPDKDLSVLVSRGQELPIRGIGQRSNGATVALQNTLFGQLIAGQSIQVDIVVLKRQKKKLRQTKAHGYDEDTCELTSPPTATCLLSTETAKDWGM